MTDKLWLVAYAYRNELSFGPGQWVFENTTTAIHPIVWLVNANRGDAKETYRLLNFFEVPEEHKEVAKGWVG